MNEWLQRPKYVPPFISEAYPSFPSVFYISANFFFWKITRKARLMPRVAEKLAKAWFPGIAFLAHLELTNVPILQTDGSTFGSWFLFSVNSLQFKAAHLKVWCLQSRILNLSEISSSASSRIKLDFLKPFLNGWFWCSQVLSHTHTHTKEDREWERKLRNQMLS